MMTHKIYIATPCYSGFMYYGYVSSLMNTIRECERRGWKYMVKFIVEDSMIHSVRNKMVRDFLASPCTDMFFIDDDIEWEVEKFCKIVESDKEMIGGLVPVRGANWYNANADNEVNEQGEMEVDFIGTAFLKLKRSMLEKMVEAYKDKECDEWGHTLFEFGYNKKGVIGEDCLFGWRWKDLGGKIYAYKDAWFGHRFGALRVGNAAKGNPQEQEFELTKESK